MSQASTATTSEIEDGADPVRHAEAVVRRSGTSFYWAMRTLPPEKRDAMYSVYAFCREVDDIADEPGDIEVKRLQLGQWRGEIERLYGGHPRHPVARALLEPIERFGLDKQDFRAMIDGMETDAGARMRIADIDELYLYCDRVACTVGRLSTRIFGLGDDVGRPLAAAQGLALQLTNILRDIHEDAARDRLYLPLDVLLAHGITDTENLDAVLADPALPRVCETLGDIAERKFIEARGLIDGCDRRSVRPAVMMLEVYHRILGKLMRGGWRDVSQRVGLSRPMKLWIAFRYGLL